MSRNGNNDDIHHSEKESKNTCRQIMAMMNRNCIILKQSGGSLLGEVSGPLIGALVLRLMSGALTCKKTGSKKCVLSLFFLPYILALTIP